MVDEVDVGYAVRMRFAVITYGYLRPVVQIDEASVTVVWGEVKTV